MKINFIKLSGFFVNKPFEIKEVKNYQIFKNRFVFLYKNEKQYINVIAFNEIALQILNFKSDEMIFIEGKINVSEFLNKNNQKNEYIQVVISNVSNKNKINPIANNDSNLQESSSTNLTYDFFYCDNCQKKFNQINSNFVFNNQFCQKCYFFKKQESYINNHPCIKKGIEKDKQDFYEGKYKNEY